MSQIDQAFIRAYEPTSTSPVSEGLLPQGGVPSPHILAHPAVEQTQEASNSLNSPEPIPAPHFQFAAAGSYQVETPIAGSPVESPSIQTAPAPVAQPISSQRQPLSSFSNPQKAQPESFDPVFEVDAFLWPDMVNELLDKHFQLLVPVAEQLIEAREAGRTMVGIAGTRSSVGCTTVQLCLARLLSQAGMKIALVDGNFQRAGLASSLGLEFDTGWEDVLRGQQPLAECVVKSLEDRMALLPLAAPVSKAGNLLSGIQTSVTAGVLRYHYDLVLFDLGAAGMGDQFEAAHQIMNNCRLDVSLIVADTEKVGAAANSSMDALMELLGPSCHGVIGNSAS